MMNDRDRICQKLAELWKTRPHRKLGEVIEQVEDRAFDLIQTRYVSARLMNLADHDFERAVDSLLSELT